MSTVLWLFLAACFILGGSADISRAIRAAKLVHETTPNLEHVTVLWIFKDWTSFAHVTTWSEELAHEDLRFYLIWEAGCNYGTGPCIKLYNSKNSKHNPVYWRIHYKYLFENGTYMPDTLNGWTVDYSMGVLLKTGREHSISWPAKTLSEIKKVIPEFQKNMLIEVDISYVSNFKKTLKPSIEYLIPSGDCQTFKDFGTKVINDDKTSDITVTTSGGSLNLHRNVIKERAREFYAQLFPNGEDEAKVSESTGKYHIELTDVSLNVFDRIIKFIYTDQIPDLNSPEEWKKLYLIARRFKVEALEEICIQKIANSVDVNNAVKWFEFSKCNGISKLEEFILEFWRMNAITMGSENWEQTMTNQTIVQCV